MNDLIQVNEAAKYGTSYYLLVFTNVLAAFLISETIFFTCFLFIVCAPYISIGMKSIYSTRCSWCLAK